MPSPRDSCGLVASKEPNHTPKFGKLVGVTRKDVVVELEDGFEGALPLERSSRHSR